MIRRTLFVLFFAVSISAAGSLGFFINEYLHMKKDFEDLRVIARNTLMEAEHCQETSRACNTSLDTIKGRLFVPTDFVPPRLAQGK